MDEPVPVDVATPEQVADELRVTVATLGKWRHAEIGPPWIRLGPRTIRYPVRDLRLWLDSCRH